MAERHTPGPWKAERGTIHHVGDIVITAAHAGMTSNTPLAHLNATVLGEEEVMPDARLIAAAPDLLEALSALEDCATGVGSHITAQAALLAETLHERILKARAAIAKATGAA